MRSIHIEKVSIPLASIKEGISDFIFRIETADLQAGFRGRFLSGIDVHVQVTTVGDDLLVDLEVKSRGSFECDRCGEPFKKDIQGNIRVLLTFDKMKGGGAQDDEIRLLPHMANEIDITQDVVDALLLAVPAKNLCRDTCKGLCPQCGMNLNEQVCNCQAPDVDPRWEALKNL